MAGRILVIRGGAIGDFILTLPALKLLREAFPETHIEILGYRHIVAVADGRFYADASRSIEYGPLAAFFNPRANLDEELMEYFASFHQVISYLFDPDGWFEGGLRRAGVKNLITGSPKITDTNHAAFQLARPLEKLALWLEEPAARIFPSEADREAAEEYFAGHHGPFVALHPGSGGERKNWPLEHWLELRNRLLADGRVGHVFVVGGESDEKVLARMKIAPDPRCTLLENLPLPVLGAVLAPCALFAGHDSGISHLAAAAGARCLLLFGPTDPDIWAPANPGATVLRAPDNDLSALETAAVWAKLDEMLSHAG